MVTITAGLVKELREKTGAGMMDCKKALSETNGDLEAAVDWLRKKGIAAAGKKSGRVATEGLIGVTVGSNSGALVEVNSETDFVARNERFQDFVATVAGLALANEGDYDAVMASGYPGADRIVDEQLRHNIATIGENISLRRMGTVVVDEGVIASYVHNAVAENLGKIGVLVALSGKGKAPALEALGKQIAMHVAAMNPAAIAVEDLDPELVAREREVLSEQARQSGKTEEVIAKMIDGRLRKFYEEVVLLQQSFVIDGKRTIEKVLSDAADEIGSPVSITAILRFGLGEGIEKKEADFAAEVAAAAAS
jgi:elongation factor Ts